MYSYSGNQLNPRNQSWLAEKSEVVLAIALKSTVFHFADGNTLVDCRLK